MTVHSRAYHQTMTSDMNPTIPDRFHPPHLSELAHQLAEARDVTAAGWHGAIANADIPHYALPHPSLAETMRRDGAVHEKLIVDALRSGEARDVIVIDREALGPDGLEMLERLNEMGLTLPAQTPASDTATSAAAPERTEFGDLRFDLKICRAYWKDQAVDLTITQFEIVRLFARRMGENLTYREIYDVVHGEGFFAGEGATGYQTNVRSLIKRIRQKFREIDDSFEAIENHRGFGYRWQDRDAGPAPALAACSHAGHDTLEPSPRSLILMVLLASDVAG